MILIDKIRAYDLI